MAMYRLLLSLAPSPRRRPTDASRGGLLSRVLSLVVLLAVSTAIGCRGDGKPTLSDLGGLETLKARFNRDTGKPRVVLLLSPT